MYIGRPGPWGNPFYKKTRSENVEDFRKWLGEGKDPRAVWIRENIHLLKGQILYCPGCKGTSPCHGDVLREYLGDNHVHQD